jgi:hypothetical protein
MYFSSGVILDSHPNIQLAPPRRARKDDHIHHQNCPDLVAAANAKKKKKKNLHPLPFLPLYSPTFSILCPIHTSFREIVVSAPFV